MLSCGGDNNAMQRRVDRVRLRCPWSREPEQHERGSCRLLHLRIGRPRWPQVPIKSARFLEDVRVSRGCLRVARGCGYTGFKLPEQPAARALQRLLTNPSSFHVGPCVSFEPGPFGQEQAGCMACSCTKYRNLHTSLPHTSPLAYSATAGLTDPACQRHDTPPTAQF